MQIVQIILSIALITIIVIQAKGTGLGSTWGGGGEFYRSKRGAEKVLFTLTIILAVLFVFTSILNAL